MDCEIRFMPSERSVRVPAGTSLLEAVRRAGLPMAQACSGDGVCGRCGLRVLAATRPMQARGRVETESLQRNDIDQDLRLACQVSLDCDVTVTATYW